MIVEFVGESGCGKSTLAELVASCVDNGRRRKGLSTADNIKALLHVLWHKTTRCTFCSIVKLSLSVNGLTRIIKNSLYLAGLVSTLFESRKDGKIWIFDQGPLQFLLSVFFYSVMDRADVVEQVRKIVAKDYLVIACHCDYETLRSRIDNRKKGGRLHRIENASKSIIELHTANLEQILSCIPNEQLIRIDTSNDLTTNAEIICSFIHSRRIV